MMIYKEHKATATEFSRIKFSKTNGKTTLSQQLSVKPLKIINTKSGSEASYCMLTNYGGGFVQGDTTYLSITCEADTRSIISSQANTRIYESNGIACGQELQITIQKNAFHAYINDPLVMHKGGVFKQKSVYKLEEGAVLLLVDWFVAGRTENGEQFQFQSFDSELEFYQKDKLILKDRFILSPDSMDVGSPATMGGSVSMLNYYLVGKIESKRVTLLRESLTGYCEHYFKKNTELNFSISQVNDSCLVGRFATSNLQLLKDMLREISHTLNNSELLGFDPLSRKY